MKFQVESNTPLPPNNGQIRLKCGLPEAYLGLTLGGRCMAGGGIGLYA